MVLSIISGFHTWLLILFHGCLLLVTEGLEPDVLNEVCITETFEANCPPQSIILIQTALYGRMKQGRCVKSNANAGCIASVITYMDGICSGKQDCDVQVSDPGLFALNKCPESTPYLETSFTCIEARTSTTCNADGVILLSGSIQGSIPSTIAYGRQSQPCPWVISAESGQHINVTLIDFNSPETRPSGCSRYADLIEDGIERPIPVCGGRQRETNVYLSKTNRLELHFSDTIPGNSEPNFILQYSILGCSDPELRGNTLVERSSEKAVLDCAGQKSYLYCRGTNWNENAPHCTSNQESDWDVFDDQGWPDASGIVLVLGIGILIGAVLGIVIAGGFLYCIKRLRRSRHPNHEIRTYSVPRQSDPGELVYNACSRPPNMPQPNSIQNPPEWKHENDIQFYPGTVPRNTGMGNSHTLKQTKKPTMTTDGTFPRRSLRDNQYHKYGESDYEKPLYDRPI